MHLPNRLIPSGISDNVSQLLIDSAHKSAFGKNKADKKDPTPPAKSEKPDPKPKIADWNEFEELTIFVHIKKLKCRWIQIAKKFPHRSRIAVRNKFIHSFTRSKFDQHNAMFRKLILNRTVQDLGRRQRRVTLRADEAGVQEEQDALPAGHLPLAAVGFGAGLDGAQDLHPGVR